MTEVRNVNSYRNAKGLVGFASLLQKRLPRAKGAAPRWLGTKVLRPDRLFMTTRHGAKLVLASNSLDVYATMRNDGDAWDYHDFQLCLNASPDGSTFYDIGANVGYFVIEMAQVTEERVTVCAFEPQSTLSAAIEASVRLNGFSTVRVLNTLVGDADRDAELHIAASSIHASAVDDSGRGATRREPNHMITLDGLADVPPPDMIKIDVEGAEHLVLRGARQILREHKPHMFIEYLPDADPGLRVRSEIQALLSDVPEYELYGDPQNDRRSNYQHRYFKMRSDSDWEQIGAVFLRNAQRPLRDERPFEP